MVWNNEGQKGGGFMAWLTPKTDWQSEDKFNFVDYNRIKNNIMVLLEKTKKLYGQLELVEMGTDIVDHSEVYEFSYFNSWEENLDIINEKTINADWGKRQTFYPNGPFITPSELNRIESAIAGIKEKLDGQESGMRKIPFCLGRFKNIRV